MSETITAAWARGTMALALIALGDLAPRAARAATVPAGFADRLVVGALDYPIGLAFLPDGRLLFVEQKTTRIRMVRDGALSATDPIVTLPDINTDGSERGLLGIAVDPEWPARPFVYVHANHLPQGTLRISRYEVTGDLTNAGDGQIAIDPGSRYDLLADVPDAAFNHNGGTLRFGADGMLYVSLGEDAARCFAQDTVSFRGVILRLRVSTLPPGPGGPADKADLLPPDNPFASSAEENARVVWAIGLRNPFRFHIDPANGALFIADVGENRREEIDRAASGGRNFGWPAYEGTLPFDPCASARGDDPIYEYDRIGGTAAVVSAGVYRGAGGAGAFPAEYEGDYFFSDYYFGFLRRLEGDGGAWAIAPPVAGQPSSSSWGTGFEEVSDYLQGADGALWYVRQAVNFDDHTGQIRRIVATPELPPPPPPADTLAVTFEAPRPTPALGATTFAFRLPEAARVALRIYDVRGRLTRTLMPEATLQPQLHEVPWDGEDDEGDPVAPGLYIARLIVNGRATDRRIPFLR